MPAQQNLGTERPLRASWLLEVQLPGHGAAVPAQQASRNTLLGDLTDRGLADHRLHGQAGSRLFATSISLRYLRILVLPYIRVARPTAWFGQEPDVVYYLGKSIPVVMRPFVLRAVATGKITRVDIQAGATTSRGHRQAGQSICITMPASRSMLYHHVVLAKLFQPTG